MLSFLVKRGDMLFNVNLIVVASKQTDEAIKSLKANCTYVNNNVWIMEGDLWVLTLSGVKFHKIGEGVVGCLGDLSTQELVKICKDVFGIDVYKQEFKP